MTFLPIPLEPLRHLELFVSSCYLATQRFDRLNKPQISSESRLRLGTDTQQGPFGNVLRPERPSASPSDSQILESTSQKERKEQNRRR